MWLIVYNLLSFVLLPAALLASMLSRRGRAWLLPQLNAQALCERLGLAVGDPQACVWMHAASVGEISALNKFLDLVRLQAPEAKIHLTCMTPLGLQYARDKLLSRGRIASASYAPFDLRPFVASALQRMPNVRCLIVVETELWPNLMDCAKRRGMRVIWLNARISHKTWRWVRTFRGFAGFVLRLFDVALFQDENSLKYFAASGGDSQRAHRIGNLKWDLELPDKPEQVGLDLRRLAGWSVDDFVWTAGSVRAGEEKIVIDVFAALRKKQHDVRLILAPRHFERVPYVRRLLEDAGLPYLLFSDLASPNAGVSVIVVDRMGELLACYAAASVVFVGGSMAPGIGGHNLLEPAALGKAVVMGPHHAHYKEIASVFEKEEALSIAMNEAALEWILTQWLRDPAAARRCGEKALEVFRSFQGAGLKAWQFLQPLF